MENWHYLLNLNIHIHGVCVCLCVCVCEQPSNSNGRYKLLTGEPGDICKPLHGNIVVIEKKKNLEEIQMSIDWRRDKVWCFHPVDIIQQSKQMNYLYEHQHG